jgi:DNA repair protein RadA/Sms
VAKAKSAKSGALKTHYRCIDCGHLELKWLGRCPSCQQWSSLVEENVDTPPARQSSAGVADGQGPVPIREVAADLGGKRLASGIGELDRVLGGGLVAGTLALLGGDPGVGKSTLLIQALAGFAGAGPILYATGEESTAQTALRARRVGADHPALSLVAETDI